MSTIVSQQERSVEWKPRRGKVVEEAEFCRIPGPMDFLAQNFDPSFSICSLQRSESFVKTQVNFFFSPSLPDLVRPSSFFLLPFSVHCHSWAHSAPSASLLSFFCIVNPSCIALSVQQAFFLEDTNGRYQW
jgi:hypothetical protein